MDTKVEAAVAMDAVLEGKAVRYYSGVNGRCCCGCSGKYTDADGSVAAKRAQNKLAKLFREAMASGQEVDLCEQYAAVISGSRIYIAYFN